LDSITIYRERVHPSASRRRRLAVVLVGAILLGLSMISTRATADAVAADSLGAGQCLEAGASLTSAGSQYRLFAQGDGNVVEYGNGRALWFTGTSGSSGPARLCLQADGDLVVLVGGVVRWSSGTAGSGGTHLVLQADANLVIYSAQGPVWNTSGPGKDTLTAGSTLEPGQYLLSPDRRFQLVAQTDGNLVLYAPEGPLWWTWTFGTGLRTQFQGDGNLVVYSPQWKALWNSATAGAGASATLSLQSDGNLVLYAGGVVKWNSGSWRVAAAPMG
jgi:pseudomonalisin